MLLDGESLVDPQECEETCVALRQLLAEKELELAAASAKVRTLEDALFAEEESLTRATPFLPPPGRRVSPPRARYPAECPYQSPPTSQQVFISSPHTATARITPTPPHKASTDLFSYPTLQHSPPYLRSPPATAPLMPLPLTSPSDVMVLTGPVVGKVTDTSATVLVEIDVDAPVTCVAKQVATGTVTRCSLRLAARVPRVFTFTGLIPDSKYDITLEGVATAESAEIRETLRGCTLRTFPLLREIDELSLVVVSGDRAADLEEGEVDLWHKAVKQRGDVVLHLGGQVHPSHSAHFQRETRAECSAALRKKHDDMAADSIRQLYRTAWSRPVTRRALAHSSHLMLPGPEDTGRGDHALKAASEYQLALGGNAMVHFLGAFVFFFVDTFQPHSFSAQRNRLQEALESKGVLCLVLCSGAPFIPLRSERQSFWATHEGALASLLDVCFSWKAEREGREVLLLSGGGDTAISAEIKDRRSTAMIRCLVVAPITSRPSTDRSLPDFTIGGRYDIRSDLLWAGHRVIATVALQITRPLGYVVPSINFLSAPTNRTREENRPPPPPTTTSPSFPDQHLRRPHRARKPSRDHPDADGSESTVTQEF